MATSFHILNGDALKERFPQEIEGQLIVARECLVDGPVGGDNLEAFFQTRADFIAEAYGDYTSTLYFEESYTEFKKIQEIPPGSTIHLWFEDDLFCQVNLWFVAHLIEQFVDDDQVFLVRPKNDLSLGFGGLNNSDLWQIYKNRVPVEELSKLADLWTFYQQNDIDALTEAALSLEQVYPFLLPAVKAHRERIPGPTDPGRPIRSLRAIIKELETEAFGPVFQEFCRRESIYGFGDSQVKRLLGEALT